MVRVQSSEFGYIDVDIGFSHARGLELSGVMPCWEERIEAVVRRPNEVVWRQSV
jgi:hypothetical protein